MEDGILYHSMHKLNLTRGMCVRGRECVCERVWRESVCEWERVCVIERVCMWERVWERECLRESVCERESVWERVCVREKLCERVCWRKTEIDKDRQTEGQTHTVSVLNLYKNLICINIIAVSIWISHSEVITYFIIYARHSDSLTKK